MKSQLILAGIVATLAVICTAPGPFAGEPSHWCVENSEIADEVLALRFERENCQRNEPCIEETKNRIIELAAEYPDDVIVQRLALRWVLFGGYTADDSDHEEYRKAYLKRAEEEPNNPVALCLAARTQRMEPEESLRLNLRALEIAPDFPWSHLDVSWASFQLSSQLPRDGDTGSELNEKREALERDVVSHLNEFLRLCPDQASSVIAIAPRFGGVDFWQPRVAQIREYFLSRQETFQTMMFPRLWNLEFALAGPEAFPKLRDRVAADVDHIRGFDMPTKYAWWETLIEGAKLAVDTELEESFLAEVPTRFPCSDLAVEAENEAIGSLRELTDTADQRNTYAKLKRLVQQCPSEFDYAFSLINTMTKLDDMEDAERVEVIEHAVEVFHDNRYRVRMYYSPYFVGAQELIKRGLQPERAVELAKLDADLRAEFEDEEFAHLEDAPEGFRAAVAASLYHKRIENACLIGEAQLANSSTDGAKEALAEAYAWMDRLEAEGIEFDPKTISRNNRTRARIFRLEASIATAEDRPADSLAFYLVAAGLEYDEGPSKNDALKLWTEMGGSDAAFAALIDAHAQTNVEFTAWENRDEPLGEFEFPDLTGKKWTLSDLRGRTVLINHWATWCGPCRLELPNVQKLYERFSEREDVLILSWNGDRSPGQVEPFVKKYGYSFPVLFSNDYLEKKQGYTSIPQTVIVDREGTVRWWQSGFSAKKADTWLAEAAEKIERLAGSQVE